MSKYLGDFAEDTTLYFKFGTVNLSQAPTALTSGVLKVYKDDDTDTEVTTGITLNVDFDGVTGLNHVTIDLSSAAFYATGSDYQVVITTGTVDSISVVGTVVREFSIENRFEQTVLAATTVLAESYGVKGAARTLSQLLHEILSLLANKATVTTTLTTKKLDTTTTAKTYTLNDDSSPTAIEDAT